MEIDRIFGTIFMISQVAAGFGLLDQIRKLYRAKNADSISLWANLIPWSSCLTGALYATMKHDIFLFVPQILSVPCGAIIITQIIYYQYFYRPVPVTVRASS